VVDKLARQPRAISAEKLAAAGLDEPQVDAVLDITRATLDTVAAAIGNTSAPGGEHVEGLRKFFEYVGTLVSDGTAWLQFDLSIVRGLAYYTGIVFELFDRSGEFRAICGGGRYDNLLGAIGGAALPALGFGMGDVVLTELLRARKLLPATEASVDYWLTADEDVPLTKVMAEAAQLRAQGFSVEYALRHQTPSKQRKSATSAGARTIIHLTNTATGSHA
jgi:histidyl-tRNA synthetase